eukprot:832453-Amphidinium_carterae.1
MRHLYQEHRAIVIGVAAFISFGVAAAFMFIFDIVHLLECFVAVRTLIKRCSSAQPQEHSPLCHCTLHTQDGKAEYAPKPLRKVFGVIRGDQDVNSRVPSFKRIPPHKWDSKTRRPDQKTLKRSLAAQVHSTQLGLAREIGARVGVGETCVPATQQLKSLAATCICAEPA